MSNSRCCRLCNNGSVILRPTDVLEDQAVDEVSSGSGRHVFFGNLMGVVPDLFLPASDELVFPSLEYLVRNWKGYYGLMPMSFSASG